MASSKWILRPSALQWLGYPTAGASDLHEYYQNDSKLARAVQIPTPPPDHCFRVGQWNVNAFRYRYNTPERHIEATAQAIAAIVLKHDPDAIVLNEFYSNSEDAASETCSAVLLAAGYNGPHIAQAAYIYPTVVFTRWHVEWSDSSISLGIDRGAVALWLKCPRDGCSFRILLYGTHLSHRETHIGHRLGEIEELLEHLQKDRSDRFEMEERIPTLIVGDFNQQREADYLPQEWQQIRENKERRRETVDDGVDTLLQENGFACGWTAPPRSNWTDDQPPPSTHWSGTVIDHVYARNLKSHGVYVSPTDLSDHRLCVSDWLLPQYDYESSRSDE